ncbi:GNAT family N-acetyltransferase [Ruminococcaceae bacterium OttesenSCG-928-I18]|nr:GNAT family N-acetyltransferase [Ruminococcaceae bacterium OttesenSCG-928-I18]
MVLYRRATVEDRPSVVALWQKVFKDEPPVVERFLDVFVGEGNQYLAQREGRTLAILSAVPCAQGSLRGSYFYALATEPAFRGQGIMAALMSYAEGACREQGAAFSCLIPASASLFSYYEKHGYATMKMRIVQKELERVGREPRLRLLCLEPESFVRLRETFFRGETISFSKPRMEMVLEGVREAGGRLAVSEEAYAVYLEKQGRLLVPEIAAKSDASASGFLSALGQELGKEHGVLILPLQSTLFAAEGAAQKLAQYKWLVPGCEKTSLYLRFGLDELFEKDYENPELFRSS